MKIIGRIVLLACVTVLTVNCGGVSQKDKEIMEATLTMKLFCLYDAAGIKNIGRMRAGITKINKEPYPGSDGTYWAFFECSLEDDGHDVYFFGDVGFDKDLQITMMPQAYGDNKIAICINGPLVVGATYTDQMPDDCKYIMDCFMNRNKIAGSE